MTPAMPSQSNVMHVLGQAVTILETLTEIAAVVPTPAQPFAPMALQVEKLLGAAISAKAATTGKTVAEVIAQLHQIQPIP